MGQPFPETLARGARLSGSEYGWLIESFPQAVRTASELSFACLGGQFQFRTDRSTCEMYWLNADSSERRGDESWAAYVSRSCCEVADAFDRLVKSSDFIAEAAKWPALAEELGPDADPVENLVFVAYFVSELEAAGLKKQIGV